MAKAIRVLVVDDETNARTALLELLENEGFDVEMAADAFKGIGKLPSFRPHVVVTDQRMPGMKGTDFMRHIAQMENAPSVIIITAYSDVDVAVDAMRAGAMDYLAKPINVAQLCAAVVRGYERWRERTSNPADRTPDVAAPPVIPGSTLEEIERYAILETLKHTGGSTSRAAEILGVTARTIQNKLKQYEDAPHSNLSIAKDE